VPLILLIVSALLILVASFLLMIRLRRLQPSPGDAGLISACFAALENVERPATGTPLTEAARSQAVEGALSDMLRNARALPDPRAWPLVVALVSGVAILLGTSGWIYWQSGRAVSPMPAGPALGFSTTIPPGREVAGTQPPGPEMNLERLAERLSERLKRQPGDAQGWVLLGRTHLATGKYADAIEAIRTATKLQPKDAAIQADLADALVHAADNKWTAESRSILQSALRLDPKQEKVLWLAGTEALERGDPKSAGKFWEKLVATANPDSPFRKQAEAGIADLQAGQTPRLKLDATPPEAVVSGTVEIADSLRAQLRAGDALYVLARRPDGSPMPIAVKRFANPVFPTPFVLDKESIMVPGTELASLRNIVVIARISHSGSPTAAPGDLEGEIRIASPGSSVRVRIDRLVK
jgi:cytochrome c-type biogenesis protein CcmH